MNSLRKFIKTHNVRRSYGPPHGDLLVDEILRCLPIAAAVRFPAVCREWNAALTSNHFIRSHRVRLAATRHPELLFFAPGTGRRHTTSFYACSLRDGAASTAAQELLTLVDIGADHAVLSPTPCRGLTLIFDARVSQYYLFNLSTGDHVTLPPCQPAAAIESMLTLPTLDTASYLPTFTPWTPFELSTTGLGFDTASGEHKVVRLFKKRNGQYNCEVYTPRGTGRWRPCFGRVPLCAASFLPGLPPVFVNGYLYWLLQPAGPGEEPIQRIMSFSMGAEQFGWVYVPPHLSSRMRHLKFANLDVSLCAVFDNRLFDGVYGLFTWSGTTSPSPSWSVRCSINLQSLPQQVSDELDDVTERVIVPLCSAGGKILLATGSHKVFAYDAEHNTVERVFRMQDFIDVPRDNFYFRMLLSVGLHDERIADVHPAAGCGRRLKVEMRRRDSTVVKREASFDEHHDDVKRRFMSFLKHMSFTY